MEETESSPRPNATDPHTDELADSVERAEGGDDGADLALQEAGGSNASPEEAPEEAVNVGGEAAPDSGSDVTDGPGLSTGAEEDVSASSSEGPQPEPETTEAEAAEAETDAAEPEAAQVAEPKAEPEPAEPEEAEAAAAEVVVPAEAPSPAASTAVAVEAEPAAGPAVEEEAVPIMASPFDPPGDWYVVHTYAGYENKVKTNLHSRIGSMQMEDKIFDVVIPMEDVMEIKGGKRQVVQKKVFPGYLLVKMIYDNDSWYVVRNTPGVTGFVSSGTGTKPTPLSRREVEKILAVKEETQAKPTFRLEWEEGDVVRIITGPFADFTGTIAEINVEQSKLKVLVNIFDRETPVELAFDQVAKS
jgi:transcriptional antiterminator NusG